MIKLFRNIRKNLLAEGKTTNYLKYAIGEIALVMIGILLALQVNNWNEKNKVNNSIENHLTILKQNITEDQDQLRQLLNTMINNSNYADSLMLQLKTLIPVDTNTTKYLGMLLMEYRFKPNINAYTTIQQSNELPALSTKLETAIIDYYALIESTNEREQISNTQISTKYEIYINNNYPLVFQKDSKWKIIQDYYKDDPRPTKKIDIKSFLSDARLEALVNARRYQCFTLKNFYSDLLKSSDSILKLLE